MKLVERYIAKNVLSATALVTIMLVGLQIFILFVNEQGDIGKGGYNLWHASEFVLLQLPYQVYLFFPMACLLGCLIGLGTMANHSELVIMRAAGMSISQIIAAVLKLAIILVTLITIASEMWIPKLTYRANNLKMQAIAGGQTLRTSNGVWLHFRNDFIFVGAIVDNNQLLNVHQFHFDKHHHLRVTRTIEKIDYLNGSWQAQGISETKLFKHKTRANTLQTMAWDVALSPALLSFSSSKPDEMTLYELHQLLYAQKKMSQKMYDYQLAYLQRLIQPFTTLVMMLLAIPFIFGPLRSSTMGSKLLAGATLGFSFIMIHRFFGPLSQLVQWPAEVAALTPTLIFTILGIYLVRRAK